MLMTMVTKNWLAARGGLHDARILRVEITTETAVLFVDDEWSNEHDGKDPSGLGAITLYGAAEAEGSIAQLAGGRISELLLETPDRLVVQMCDRDLTVVAISSASWTAGSLS